MKREKLYDYMWQVEKLYVENREIIDIANTQIFAATTDILCYKYRSFHAARISVYFASTELVAACPQGLLPSKIALSIFQTQKC